MTITLIIAFSCLYVIMVTMFANIFNQKLGIRCEEDKAVVSVLLGIFWPIGALAIIGWIIGDRIISLIKK